MKAKVKEEVTLTLTLREALTVKRMLRKPPKKPDTPKENMMKRVMWSKLDYGIGIIHLLRDGYTTPIEDWDGSYDS